MYMYKICLKKIVNVAEYSIVNMINIDNSTCCLACTFLPHWCQFQRLLIRNKKMTSKINCHGNILWQYWPCMVLSLATSSDRPRSNNDFTIHGQWHIILSFCCCCCGFDISQSGLCRYWNFVLGKVLSMHILWIFCKVLEIIGEFMTIYSTCAVTVFIKCCSNYTV